MTRVDFLIGCRFVFRCRSVFCVIGCRSVFGLWPKDGEVNSGAGWL